MLVTAGSTEARVSPVEPVGGEPEWNGKVCSSCTTCREVMTLRVAGL
jgi:hypothetical protein